VTINTPRTTPQSVDQLVLVRGCDITVSSDPQFDRALRNSKTNVRFAKAMMTAAQMFQMKPTAEAKPPRAHLHQLMLVTPFVIEAADTVAKWKSLMDRLDKQEYFGVEMEARVTKEIIDSIQRVNFANRNLTPEFFLVKGVMDFGGPETRGDRKKKNLNQKVATAVATAWMITFLKSSFTKQWLLSVGHRLLDNAHLRDSVYRLQNDAY